MCCERSTTRTSRAVDDVFPSSPTRRAAPNSCLTRASRSYVIGSHCSTRMHLCTARQSGQRKADLASLDEEREAHEMGRDNLTWYLSDGAGGYVHVPELPPAHVLVDNECACLRPAASKADQTAEHFGNQLIYLPVVHSDVNNAALALAQLEHKCPCHGSARVGAPLLWSDDRGTPLTCDRIDTVFSALARHALGDAVGSLRSFHSARIFAACCHKAHNESDAMIQALCRWRSPESLRIYARINPRDYAARVRRMSSTTVDSTLAANLPVLDDSALHADFANVIGPLEQGRDIADTCGVHVDSDDEGGDEDEAAEAGASSAPAPPPRSTPPARPQAAQQPQAAAQRKRPAVQQRRKRKRPKVPDNVNITVKQSNPKRPGSSSHARYEAYKRARTRAQFIALGGTSKDFAHDVAKGFVVVV